MKYIDAEKLKAEINRLKGLLNSRLCECLTIDYKAGGNKQLDLLLSFIDSLQQEQPEVDLEKEIEMFGTDERPTKDDLISFARHFYERGIEAGKKK
jgi:hypothetical protein